MPRAARRTAAVVAAVLATTFGATAGAGSAAADPTNLVVESTPAGPSSQLPDAAEARTFTYRTSGADGLSSGLLFVPEGTAPEGGWPIVAWAHGTVGMADSDAPSRTGVNYPIYQRLFTDWLRRGFVIVATDYAGLGTPGPHPYLDANVAAHNVVDSVRAARQLIPQASNVWAVAGQSQGGHAALATAVRADTLAPELDFRGTFASGAPTNLDKLAALAGPNFPDVRLDGVTLYLVYIAAGLRQSRPDLDIDSYLTPLGRELVDAADSTPLEKFKPRTVATRVGDLFARSLAGTPVPQAITDYLGVPTGGYDKPMMLVQGLEDSVMPAPLGLWFMAELALSGTRFNLELPEAGHVDSLDRSIPDAGWFLERILA